MKIPVIIPAYNEAENIAELLRELRREAPEALAVVVNDGSADDTARVAATEGAVVLDLPCNLGVGGAVQTGFRYAVENGFDFAVRIDGDGQHPPAEIGKLLRVMEESGADAVIGSRYLGENNLRNCGIAELRKVENAKSGKCEKTEKGNVSVRGATATRDAGNMALAWFLSLICRCRVTDPSSGFWCVRGDLLRCFAKHYPGEYPEPEAIAMLRRHGYTLAEAPINARPRSKGVSTIKTSGVLYYALRVSLALCADRMRPTLSTMKKNKSTKTDF
ncbi:MAG: glycosyltransferase family 2 protein [Kiritimatiellaeota bacterium]|nr:glycosyltransferase family 2 protein [Kiritimatiellota bacterium]